MMQFVATFHTHLAALKTHRRMTAEGVSARMAPVPRKISSSCGTCVFYQAEDACYGLLDTDTEAELHERIKVAEREMLVAQLGKVARGGLRVEAGRAVVGRGWA